ncbi:MULTISPECIES: hypothetical protein [unclassified Acidiphilium]|uniref:hypothetical protein n=1 Tax=unclassified Acidiphilium TaxID=2617493 RepID=UPI000BCD7905|nr:MULTISPECIES: hypothetical protein [unclassified Acidiphilium]OYV54524.1 MAG: hypothetical protein B7Z76_14205 [Acidiphilium sp. 20-67-58]HQT62527.1 hypothetical protein [Acidiphilium sp.]
MAGARSRSAPVAPLSDLGPRGRRASDQDATHLGKIRRGLWLAEHADIDIIEQKTEGRRAARQYIHRRLLTAGRITGAEFEVAEQWWRDHALASGATLDTPKWQQMPGGSGPEPAERTIDAITRLRVAYERVGQWRGAILRAALCDGHSLRKLAARFCGGEGGRACAEAEALVIVGLEMLAGTRRQRSLDTRRDS